MPNRLPLLVVVSGLLAMAGWLYAIGDPSRPGGEAFWFALAGAAAVSLAFHLRLRVALARVADPVATMLRERDRPLPSGTISRLREAVHALSAELSEGRAWLDAELHRRRESESSLLQSEERYALAVRGADDGMWEWNLRTGSFHYSPRWKAMVGFAEHEIGDSAEEWRSRIHPQDANRVESELQSHLHGRSERFESEHRLRHRDGGYRWIRARGTAMREASGKAYRMIGLHTDISARKNVQEALLDIADGLSTLTGEACFRQLTRRFAEAMGVREAFVCECSDFPTTRVRMLARWNRGGFSNCVEFDLAGTSCEDVIHTGRPLYVPGNLGARWPLEKTYDRESYLGLPCVDTRGRVIGHIACADGGAMHRELPHLAVLKIFAIRAAVELERRLLERERGIPIADNPSRQ